MNGSYFIGLLLVSIANASCSGFIYHLPGLGVFLLTEFLCFFQFPYLHMQIYSKQLSSSSFRYCCFVCSLFSFWPPHPFLLSLIFHLWQAPMCSYYLWDWVFLGFVLGCLDFTCKRDHTIFFSYLTCFT